MYMDAKERAGLMVASCILSFLAFLMTWYVLSYQPPPDVVAGTGVRPFELSIHGVDLGTFYPMYKSTIRAMAIFTGTVGVFGLLSFLGTNFAFRSIQRLVLILRDGLFLINLIIRVRNGSEVHNDLNYAIPGMQRYANPGAAAGVDPNRVAAQYLTLHFDLGMWVMTIGFVVSAIAAWSRDGDDASGVNLWAICTCALVVAACMLLWVIGR